MNLAIQFYDTPLVALLLDIRKVLCSYLDHEIGYPDSVFRIFPFCPSQEAAEMMPTSNSSQNEYSLINL